MSLYHVSWAENPLVSPVRLTDAGYAQLKLGIAIDAISSQRACMSLAKQEKDWAWLDRDDIGSDIGAYIEHTARIYREALLDCHCGDCTCVPATCMKCVAEETLGMPSTTLGLGKHAGHEVMCAFRDGRTTVAEALDWLHRDVQPASSWGPPVAAHLARWVKMRGDAIAWLVMYRTTRLTPSA